MRSFIAALRYTRPGQKHEVNHGRKAGFGAERLKRHGEPADAPGMDPISARNLEAYGAAIEKQRSDAKNIGDAMIKLIEVSASVGRQTLPPDATFHTYA
jgi:hypothetical protein